MYYKPLTYTGVAVMPTKALFVAGPDVFSLDHEYLEEFKFYCKNLHSDDELITSFHSMKYWQNYKSKIIRNVRIEKVMRRQNFDQSLRKPVLTLYKSYENLGEKFMCQNRSFDKEVFARRRRKMMSL
jgi:hypothetical protein